MSAPRNFENMKKIKQQDIKIETLQSKKNIEIEIYTTPGNTIDWFKNYIVLDGITPGVHIFQLDLNGNISMAVVIKANNKWISFINFGYEKENFNHISMCVSNNCYNIHSVQSRQRSYKSSRNNTTFCN